MAGHSKFSNIQHRKGAQDKKRGKVFAKLAKEVMVAAKLGMPDPDHNPRLRAAIQAAKSQSMPKDNIDRAIKRATDQGGEDFFEIRYEGFGPAGTGVIVEALTDNKNRSASDIRAIFTKNGGNLGETGAVSFMFDHVGSIKFGPEAADADTMLEAAIDAGADDCISDDDGHELICEVGALHEVARALEDKFGEPQSAQMIWKPQNLIEVVGAKVGTVLKLMDALEDCDDVQTVYANFDISEEELAKLEG